MVLNQMQESTVVQGVVKIESVSGHAAEVAMERMDVAFHERAEVVPTGAVKCGTYRPCAIFLSSIGAKVWLLSDSELLELAPGTNVGVGDELRIAQWRVDEVGLTGSTMRRLPGNRYGIWRGGPLRLNMV
jgi:hypothetical protein